MNHLETAVVEAALELHTLKTSTNYAWITRMELEAKLAAACRALLLSREGAGVRVLVDLTYAPEER